MPPKKQQSTILSLDNHSGPEVKSLMFKTTVQENSLQCRLCESLNPLDGILSHSDPKNYSNLIRHMNIHSDYHEKMVEAKKAYNASHGQKTLESFCYISVCQRAKDIDKWIRWAKNE